MSHSFKKVIFLGNPVPEHMVEASKVHNVNIADNIAQNTLIQGLHQYYGEDLKVMSVSADKQPVDLDLGYGVNATRITSNNLNRGFYYLSIAKNYAKKLNELLKLNGSNDKTIIITNGAYVYMAWPALIARLRFGVKWVPFLVGSVEIPEAKFPWSILSKLSRFTSKKADGAITYVANSAIDYMPGKPFVEIAYLIDDKIMDIYKQPVLLKPDKFTITYTGALTNIYNIDVIVEVIKKTADKYKWVFAGVGQNADAIQKLANDERYDVEYLGAVSNLDAIQLQKNSHLLLCLRGGDRSKVNQYYSKYAASGKLIEYLCSGTPILAGDIPGFSDKIKPFMTCEKDQSATTIVDRLETIVRNYDKSQKAAREGQNYAFKYFTATYQNKNIFNYLEKL